jgi:hypothetical protein
MTVAEKLCLNAETRLAGDEEQAALQLSCRALGRPLAHLHDINKGPGEKRQCVRTWAERMVASRELRCSRHAELCVAMAGRGRSCRALHGAALSWRGP